jgi:hypothetical protein
VKNLKRVVSVSWRLCRRAACISRDGALHGASAPFTEPQQGSEFNDGTALARLQPSSKCLLLDLNLSARRQRGGGAGRAGGWQTVKQFFTAAEAVAVQKVQKSPYDTVKL